MKVRTRLVASFAYVLVVVITALTVPLAIVLRDRARSEQEALVRTNAQTIAAVLNGGRLKDAAEARQQLSRDVERYATEVGGRVVVLDVRGMVIADSDGEDLGQSFVTPGRPEVARAFDSIVSAEVRPSVEEGGDIAVAAAPIIDSGMLLGVVRLSRGVQAVEENVSRATAAIALVALGGLAAGLAIALALARSLAGPLSRLAGAARRLGAGDLSTRAGSVPGGAELQELAGSFDEMAGRVERTVRAQQEFVANASHQLRTPLTGIKLRLEAAMAESTDEAVVHELEVADQEVDRLAAIIERLLSLATRVEEGRVALADVDDAVARSIARWRDRARQASSSLEGRGIAALARVDPHDLDQVLDVLIDNAITHAPGIIEISATSNGGIVTVSVRDQGPGIAPDDRSRVTERFFRGQGAPPGGSGLGLAIAHELAEQWGGGLRISAADGIGSRVEAWFPMVDSEHGRAEA